ncbi:MAG: hypothetical protein K2W95_31120 [Candidatus Obscuribacterales bacterium]|nr:hypothetical protein [Candidatus Obscuribacterales bacterium]
MKVLSILILSAIMTLSAPSPMLCANNTWENQSRLAHQLTKENRLTDALGRYDEAITLIKKQNDNLPILLDLQLNKIHLLIESGRVEEAEKYWKKIGRDVESINDPFVEIRYWRRARELSVAKRDNVETAGVDGRLVKLVQKTMGRGSDAYVNVVKTAIESSTAAKLWAPAMTAALELKQLNKDCIRPRTRKVIRQTLTCFFVDSSGLLTEPALKRGELSRVADFLESFGNYAPYPLALIQRWEQVLRQACTKPHQEAVVQKCCDNLVKIEKLLDKSKKEERERIAGDLLLSVLSDVYNGTVLPQTEARLRIACDVMTRAASNSKELHSSVLFIQCSSLHALALAKQGRLEDAERVLIGSEPAPGAFKEASNFYGIFQARQTLGTAFLKRGDKAAVSRQFDAIFALLKSVDQSSLKKNEMEYWLDLKTRTLK